MRKMQPALRNAVFALLYQRKKVPKDEHSNRSHHIIALGFDGVLSHLGQWKLEFGVKNL